MGIRQRPRQVWFRRALAAAIAIVAVAGLVWLGDRLTAVPATQREAEAHLDRSLLFYEVWDGTGYVVFEFGGTLHFDRLRLDLVSIEWPPTPRWQWTGMWWTIDTTTGPASAGVGSTSRLTGPSTTDPPGHYVIFGQVNDPEITWLEVQSNGEWARYPVAAPGYAIRLPPENPRPTAARWLDAHGEILWTAPVQDG